MPKEEAGDERQAEKDLEKIRQTIFHGTGSIHELTKIKRVAWPVLHDDVAKRIGINEQSKRAIEDIIGKKTVFIADSSP